MKFRALLYFFVTIGLICSSWGISSVFTQNDSVLGKGVYGPVLYSPDGTYLAFSFDSDDRHELWLLETETNDLNKLEVQGRPFLRAGTSWQDGRTLWFISSISVVESPLYKLDVVDGTSDLILSSTNEWSGFSVHPFRDELVYSQAFRQNGKVISEIFSFNISNQSIHPVFDTPDEPKNSPLWSPNGNILAFHTKDGIGLLEKNGFVRVLEVNSKGGISSLAWSPNSEAILFIGNYDNSGLYLIPIDGDQSPEQVLSASISYVSWSPDGSQIAYTTLGVPGENDLHIVDTKDLGLEKYFREMEEDITTSSE